MNKEKKVKVRHGHSIIKDKIKTHEELSGNFKLLGVFLYVHFVIKLLAAKDEHVYVVVVIPHESAITTKYYSPDLSSARSKFEETVHCCLHDTSLSDVSIFMQQHVGV